MTHETQATHKNRHIFATSGGFFSDDRGGLRVAPLFHYAAQLSRRADAPRVCFINTAAGDSAAYYTSQYAAVARDIPHVQPSHLALFVMPNVKDVRAHLLTQDVIWVGGGSVINLLAVWRAHQLDVILRDAWEAGVVLGGVSAGSLCWHVGGTTDSFGPDLQPITNGLGFLPHSNCPHYDSEEQRRPLFQKCIADGTLPNGWATDDGVGLHFRDEEFVGAFSERRDAYAWRVERDAEQRTACETRIVPTLLDGAM